MESEATSMEQRSLTDVKIKEGVTEDHSRLPKLFRLDDVILTHMLLSRKPILAVSKSILKPRLSGEPERSADLGEECFVFHANWHATC
jgi:hypothetical protein